MSVTTAKNDKGLKRICGSCATRFYDFNKAPIVCPKCGEEFTGAGKIKSRRSRKSADDIATEKPVKAKKNTENDSDVTDEIEEDLDTDLDLDKLANIDDEDNDDLDDDGDDLDLSRVTSD